MIPMLGYASPECKGCALILISSRALAEVEEYVRAIPVEELQLKGISSPVDSYNVVGLSEGDE